MRPPLRPGAAFAILIVASCSSCHRMATPDRTASAREEEDDEGVESLQCEPGQVNDLGVGRPCKTNEDCRGFSAAMCAAIKGPDRPHICFLLCDRDEQCGPDAMCGLIRGWIRACFPKRCSDFRYEADRVRPPAGPPAAHRGAIACDAGVSFSSEGWGTRCRKNAECRAPAAGCEVAIYPPGIPICEKECRTDATCGADAYCSYAEVTGFSFCVPRCPEPRHRDVAVQPARLDRCAMRGEMVPPGNEQGVGHRCESDADCAGTGGAKVCGRSLPGVHRRPDSCTHPCAVDEDCGRNAVCVDLDYGLPGATPARYCVPACWAI